MHEILRAPELSATSRMVLIWIMTGPPSALGARGGRLAGAGEDLLHPPPLVPAQRPRLHDAHGVALAGALLVVGHEGGGAPDGLAVHGVLHQPLHRHHHRLLHAGLHHHAHLLVAAPGGGRLRLAGAHLRHGPWAAEAWERSRSTDLTRAMSRRVSRIFMALSSWPMDFWKRRRNSCSCSSRSLFFSSSAPISLSFSAFMPRPRPASRTWSSRTACARPGAAPRGPRPRSRPPS